MGVKGRLFKVESDFQVGEERENYSATGYGESLALGAMYATPNLNPKKRIKTALKAAAKFSTGVAGPYVIKETE